MCRFLDWLLGALAPFTYTKEPSSSSLWRHLNPFPVPPTRRLPLLPQSPTVSDDEEDDQVTLTETEETVDFLGSNDFTLTRVSALENEIEDSLYGSDSETVLPQLLADDSRQDYPYGYPKLTVKRQVEMIEKVEADHVFEIIRSAVENMVNTVVVGKVTQSEGESSGSEEEETPKPRDCPLEEKEPTQAVLRPTVTFADDPPKMAQVNLSDSMRVPMELELCKFMKSMISISTKKVDLDEYMESLVSCESLDKLVMKVYVSPEITDDEDEPSPVPVLDTDGYDSVCTSDENASKNEVTEDTILECDEALLSDGEEARNEDDDEDDPQQGQSSTSSSCSLVTDEEPFILPRGQFIFLLYDAFFDRKMAKWPPTPVDVNAPLREHPLTARHTRRLLSVIDDHFIDANLSQKDIKSMATPMAFLDFYEAQIPHQLETTKIVQLAMPFLRADKRANDGKLTGLLPIEKMNRIVATLDADGHQQAEMMLLMPEYTNLETGRVKYLSLLVKLRYKRLKPTKRFQFGCICV